MRRILSVSAKQRQELESVIAHHPKPYVRERAAAVLKVADGAVAAQVAHSGLFQRRHQDTVYAWLDRYQAEGVSGLLNRPGRGRKPAFSPSASGGSRGRIAPSTRARSPHLQP